MREDGTPSAPFFLLLLLCLTLSFIMLVYSQEYILRGGSARGFPGVVPLLSLLGPLSGFLTGLLRAQKLTAPPLAPKRAHFFLGLLLWGSSAMSTRATQHLSMPVSLVLAIRSTKILPTMVIASLWLRKRFLPLDWAAALLSAVGMILCLDAGGAIDAALAGAGAGAACATLACRLGPWLGAAQMGLALILDGGCANAQEAIIRQFSSPPQEIALLSYGCATLASLAHGLLQPAHDNLAAGVAHTASNPHLCAAAALYALASCGATWCSIELIAGFGASSFMLVSALAKALVTTVSIAMGKGSVPAAQLLGITLVFSATALAAMAKSAQQEAAGAAALAGAGALAEASQGAAAAGGSSGEEGLKIRLPGVQALGSGQQGSMGAGAAVARTLITPRTAGVELGLEQDGSTSVGGLRRRGVAGTGAAAAQAQPRQQQQQQVPAVQRGEAFPPPPSTPLRKTLSSALSLVSAAALGIQRPQPQAEALSPLALTGSSGGGSGSSAATTPTTT